MFESLMLVPLFQDLQADQLALLEPLFELYTYPPGTIVFEQGSFAAYLYIILEGSAVIQYKPYDGPYILVTHLRPGDIFGWSAVIGSPYYTSGILSESAMTAIRMRGADLRNLCLQHPETGRNVLERLAGAVSARWKNARTQVQSMLDNGMVKSNGAQKKKKGEKIMSTISTPSQELQIRGLLERLSAYVEQFHGGSVEFVSFDGKTLKVRLGGACLGCPLQPSTLHGWVAGTVHQFFPNIEVMEEK